MEKPATSTLSPVFVSSLYSHENNVLVEKMESKMEKMSELNQDFIFTGNGRMRVETG
ncbi:hypothetical protein [uncultured Brevibacillus sp.]|uniref:hypothetical protein n=1 Tax=uncultured Brevibacillus sp. TaxID=169970 RepID=UPI00259A5B91|nr:hypothetical protein [uncultured Brevibacillus sp.]